MDKKLTITAVSGWAISKEWFAAEVANAFPDSRVEVIYPMTPDKQEEAEMLLQRYPADLYIGYSLGSLWLLKYKHFLPKNTKKALLAPILSFLKSDSLGGTTSQTQLKYLSRVLQKNLDKQTTLKSFYSYSNLPFHENIINDLPDTDTLIRGLDFLNTFRVKGEDAKLFLSIVGENDIFINTDLLKQHIPHLDIIQGVGHAPGNLLKRLAGQLN